MSVVEMVNGTADKAEQLREEVMGLEWRTQFIQGHRDLMNGVKQLREEVMGLERRT